MSVSFCSFQSNWAKYVTYLEDWIVGIISNWWSLIYPWKAILKTRHRGVVSRLSWGSVKRWQGSTVCFLVYLRHPQPWRNGGRPPAPTAKQWACTYFPHLFRYSCCWVIRTRLGLTEETFLQWGYQYGAKVWLWSQSQMSQRPSLLETVTLKRSWRIVPISKVKH